MLIKCGKLGDIIMENYMENVEKSIKQAINALVLYFKMWKNQTSLLTFYIL